MKLLVCGGRDYEDSDRVNHCLTKIHEKYGITEIVEGGAEGADSLCAKWARYRGIKVTTFKADWRQYGKAAGPIRNREMAEYQPDYCCAFPGGSGTLNMIRTCDEHGIKVWRA